MYTCGFCTKEFSTSSNKLRHVKQFHSEGVSSEQTKGSPANDDDNSVAVWNMILKRVYNTRYPNPEKNKIKAEEMLGSEQEVKAILAVMQKEIADILKAAEYLENDCAIYKRLKKTLEKLKEEDYSKEESQIVAFKNRRYMLQSLLHDHVDVLKQHLGSF